MPLNQPKYPLREINMSSHDIKAPLNDVEMPLNHSQHPFYDVEMSLSDIKHLLNAVETPLHEWQGSFYDKIPFLFFYGVLCATFVFLVVRGLPQRPPGIAQGTQGLGQNWRTLRLPCVLCGLFIFTARNARVFARDAKNLLKSDYFYEINRIRL